MKQKTKIFIAAIALIFIFSALTVLKTQAGTGESGMGWLWDGSDDGVGNNTALGWISMNSANCDANGNGFIDATCGGDDTTTTSSVNYGVNIPASDGALSGYAWSENIGWIDFAPAGPYPAAPNYSAQRTGNNLEGWTRITGIAQAGAAGNSGGWEGWMKLNGVAQDGSPYEVSINPTDGKMTGYGWSDELGWVDFYRAFINATPPAFSCIPPLPSAASATLCPGDDTGLSADINVTIVGAAGLCSVPIKCEYYCNAGYQQVGNSCVACVDTCYDQACTIADCEKSLPRGCSNPCNAGNLCAVNNCGIAAPCPACPKPSGNWKEVAP